MKMTAVEKKTKIQKIGTQAESKFAPPIRSSTPTEQRKMIALALETAVLAVMNGDLYSNDNKVRIQKEGRPIGLQLTDVLAKLVILSWASEYVRTLAMISTSMVVIILYMLKIYVDDANAIIEELPPGTGFKEGELTVATEEVKRDINPFLHQIDVRLIVPQTILTAGCRYWTSKSESTLIRSNMCITESQCVTSDLSQSGLPTLIEWRDWQQYVKTYEF